MTINTAFVGAVQRSLAGQRDDRLLRDLCATPTLDTSNKISVDRAPSSDYLLIPMTRKEFQSRIEGFIARYRLSPTTFGLWAMNDSRFLFDLRRGRSCSLATVEKVTEFMTAYEAKQEAKRLSNLNQG